MRMGEACFKSLGLLVTFARFEITGNILPWYLLGLLPVLIGTMFETLGDCIDLRCTIYKRCKDIEFKFEIRVQFRIIRLSAISF